jgi:coatomer protein complex subunit epsilon
MSSKDAWSYSDVLQGGEKYQQAFYVFEELAQAPSTSSAKSLVSQAVSEIHLGRLEEAEAALQQVLAKDPKSVDSLANSIVLNVIAGKDVSELTRYAILMLSSYVLVLTSYHSTLTSTAPEHPFLRDVQEKSALFDQAATKYSAKVSA